ncbi:MAG: S8 family serine peptidase [Pirellulaceae bacterium]
MAGIIASDDTNHPGLATGVDIVALRVFNDSGYSELRWIEQALDWVHAHQYSFEHPITTVNLSVSYNPLAGNSIITTLDDELATLKNDGIFVAVAAGNAFNGNTPATVSYPASNPHVVPVASLNAEGQLSSFSQRSADVLAAPGERIVSTAPDYLFDFNGKTDDFAVSSGTSMATPYVAGASILVRQAMQAHGVTTITPDAIYSHLQQTADVIYDAASQANIHRVNLSRALDAFAANDDHGSSPSEATLLDHSAGNRFTETVSGSIEKANDRDYFRFVAPQNGMLTVNVDTLPTGWQWLTEQGTVQDKTLRIPLTAGSTTTFGVTASTSADYAMLLQWQSAHQDLGTLAYASVDIHAAGPQLYKLTTANQAWLSVVAANQTDSHPIRLTLWDNQGKVLDQSSQSSRSMRIDSSAVANQTVWLQTDGPLGTQIDIVNQVQQQGDSLNLFGSHMADNFQVSLDGSGQIQVNGVSYQTAGVHSIMVHGQFQNDTVHAIGSRSTDVITLSPQQLSMRNAYGTLEATGVFTVRVDGQGGVDRATFYDSSGNDQFRTTPGYARMMSSNYYNIVENVSTVFANSTTGRDRSEMYDSVANDRYIATPDYASMQGPGYQRQATGFALTYAYANSGGNDQAFVYDSVGPDDIVMTPEYARLRSTDRFAWAEAFESTFAYSLHHDGDRVDMTGSADPDRYTSNEQYAQMTGAGFHNQATGFKTVYADGAGGDDVAELRDTAGDDHIRTGQAMARIMSDQYYSYAASFETITIQATGQGVDRVFMYDSPADDPCVGTPEYAEMSGADFDVIARGFARVFAYSANGGHDSAMMLDSTGNDIFVQNHAWSVLKGTAFWNYIEGFDHIAASATHGFDEVRILCRDEPGTLSATSDTSTQYTTAQQQTGFTGFDTLVGFRHDQRIVEVDLDDVDQLFKSIQL